MPSQTGGKSVPSQTGGKSVPPTSGKTVSSQTSQTPGGDYRPARKGLYSRPSDPDQDPPLPSKVDPGSVFYRKAREIGEVPEITFPKDYFHQSKKPEELPLQPDAHEWRYSEWSSFGAGVPGCDNQKIQDDLQAKYNQNKIATKSIEHCGLPAHFSYLGAHCWYSWRDGTPISLLECSNVPQQAFSDPDFFRFVASEARDTTPAYSKHKMTYYPWKNDDEWPKGMTLYYALPKAALKSLEFAEVVGAKTIAQGQAFLDTIGRESFSSLVKLIRNSGYNASVPGTNLNTLEVFKMLVDENMNPSLRHLCNHAVEVEHEFHPIIRYRDLVNTNGKTDQLQVTAMAVLACVVHLKFCPVNLLPVDDPAQTSERRYLRGDPDDPTRRFGWSLDDCFRAVATLHQVIYSLPNPGIIQGSKSGAKKGVLDPERSLSKADQSVLSHQVIPKANNKLEVSGTKTGHAQLVARFHDLITRRSLDESSEQDMIAFQQEVFKHTMVLQYANWQAADRKNALLSSNQNKMLTKTEQRTIQPPISLDELADHIDLSYKCGIFKKPITSTVDLESIEWIRRIQSQTLTDGTTENHSQSLEEADVEADDRSRAILQANTTVSQLWPDSDPFSRNPLTYTKARDTIAAHLANLSLTSELLPTQVLDVASLCNRWGTDIGMHSTILANDPGSGKLYTYLASLAVKREILSLDDDNGEAMPDLCVFPSNILEQQFDQTLKFFSPNTFKIFVFHGRKENYAHNEAMQEAIIDVAELNALMHYAYQRGSSGQDVSSPNFLAYSLVGKPLVRY